MKKEDHNNVKWRKLREFQMRYWRCMESHPGKKERVSLEWYKNPNVYNSQTNRNEKLEKAKDIIDELEADVVEYSEID